MRSRRIKVRIQRGVQWIQGFVDRPWYPPLIGFLAFLDNFVIVIPNDGILVSSSMVTPKRWWILALCVAIGSTLGATVLVAAIQYHGLPWILDIYPHLDETKTWEWSEKLFDQYGLLLVFAVSVTPLLPHPAIILASLAQIPLAQLGLVILLGRLIKFLILAYIGSHTPKLLRRLWGFKGELVDAGIEIK